MPISNRGAAGKLAGANLKNVDATKAWQVYYPTTYYPYYPYSYYYPAVVPSLYSTYLGYYTPWRIYGTAYTGPLLPASTDSENDVYVKALAAHSAASDHPPMTFAEFEKALANGGTVLDASKVSALRANMRDLWDDHEALGRNLVISVVAKLPDVDAVTARLLRNADDIADVFRPYLGDAAGSLGQRLRDHVTSTANVLQALKAGDAAKADKAKADWYANGDDVARALADANPAGWPLSDTQRLMRAHLDATMDEATARLQSRWADDLAAHDRMNKSTAELADLLALGIVEQHHDKFSR